MLSVLTYEQIRQFFVWLTCSVVAALTPTAGFVTALVFAWAFNVWCGMRADGVVIITCKNWSWKKFAHACAELVMFLCIIWLVALITYFCGDIDEGLYACKTINYVFALSYFQNGLKNLCKAHPQNRSLWIIYLFVRFDFSKMLRIDTLIERYEEHVNNVNELVANESK